MPSQESSKQLIELLKLKGINNESVLQAMTQVPRELFVISPYESVAYEDRALPIESGQTISQPFIVALMTQIINPQADDIILEIGTGSGYQAAILSLLCKRVYSIEYIPELHQSAKKRLQNLGYYNIDCIQGDGALGLTEKAPFNHILVTCGCEKIPEELYKQLKEGGSILAPVGPLFNQWLTLHHKVSGKIINEPLDYPVRFVPLLH